MKLPAYAVINDTVSACSLLGKNWAKGFINAVLRKVNRQKKEVGDLNLSKQNHPAWFVNKLKNNIQNDGKQYVQQMTSNQPWQSELTLLGHLWASITKNSGKKTSNLARANRSMD